MKLNANTIGLVTVTVATIALVGLVCNVSAPAYDRQNCAAHEVFRSSDSACYVPQGE